ncbi:MAG: hypothetical protein Q9212_002930 [Teloschistes hypoglaucus]
MDKELAPHPLRINKRKRPDFDHRGLLPAAKIPRVRGVTMSNPPAFMKSWSAAKQNEALESTRSSRSVSLPLLHSLPRTTSLGTVRQETSLKHRVLSRVMHSLIGNKKRPLVEAFGKDRQFQDYGRESTSSAGSDSSLFTSLETALSEFPVPPVSIIRSPSTLCPSQRQLTDKYPYRTLCAPNDVAIVRPEIKIIPETDVLGPDSNQKVFVAVEVSAVAELSEQYSRNGFCGLDVAVVVDNSLFASPATLMASCETARYISSLLDPSNDRMAIVCTSMVSAQAPELRTIMPLSSVNPRRTKAAVDAVVSSTGRPTVAALDESIRSAMALLGQSTPRDTNGELSPVAFGHIFVLSPNIGRISPKLLSHDRLQLHLINTGSVPWRGSAEIRSSGWRIQSTHSKEVHLVSCGQDEDPSSVFKKLRGMIAGAHKGSVHGAVSDMILEIMPGKECAIEGIIGSRSIPCIQPGDTIVALVRLKVGLPPAVGYKLTHRCQREGSSSPCDDPSEELDKLLGTTPVVVLTAKLRYRHSLLRPDTQCTISTSCRMKRQLSPPKWADIGSKPIVGGQKDTRAEVQKRFAFHIATHHAPQQAMMVLIEDFGDGGRRSVCPEYIKLLLDELKYQARTIERFDLAEYRCRPILATPREMRPDNWGQEHFGQGLFDASNYKPQEWITDVLCD